MPESAAPERTATARELARLDAAITEGLRLARAAGRAEPTLRDAVWELLVEAADTLRRLPNRERGWLTAASRAHWPDHLGPDHLGPGHLGPVRLRDVAGESRAHPPTASGEAIDRLDSVLAWLPQAAGSNPKRDLAVLFGLACGVRVAVLRRSLGCGRRTVYDVRDRGIARLCGWLRQRSDYCRSLQ